MEWEKTDNFKRRDESRNKILEMARKRNTKQG